MRAHINITGSSFLRAIGHHLLRFKILTLSCLPHSAEQGIMPIGGLIVNLLLKCLSLKELVSQEADGEVGLGVWAKGLGWEGKGHQGWGKTEIFSKGEIVRL